MSLYIRNEETDRLARAVAERTGETLTDAVTVALRERLERLPDASSLSKEERFSRAMEIARRSAALPNSPLTEDELMYDEFGLPK